MADGGDSIAELRSRLQQQWAALDTDGDGRVDTGELMDKYDTSGDGTLDAEEVSKLAAQLSEQAQYNNQLLEQLQRLEEEQLDAQRDVQAKQVALREALDVCERVREEASTLKNKLAIAEVRAAGGRPCGGLRAHPHRPRAQDVAQKMREEARQAQISANVKSREVEGLQQYADEARAEIQQLKEERGRVASPRRTAAWPGRRRR